MSRFESPKGFDTHCGMIHRQLIILEAHNDIDFDDRINPKHRAYEEAQAAVIRTAIGGIEKDSRLIAMSIGTHVQELESKLTITKDDWITHGRAGKFLEIAKQMQTELLMNVVISVSVKRLFDTIIDLTSDANESKSDYYSEIISPDLTDDLEIIFEHLSKVNDICIILDEYTKGLEDIRLRFRETLNTIIPQS